MITFPRAPLVAPGERVTSTQLAGLVDAINARPRSGLGDGVFRVLQYILGMCRQIRNPDADRNLWAPEAEALQGLQMLDPTAATWPTSGAGDPEGINVNSVLGALVFGNSTANLASEDARLSDPNIGGVPLWLGFKPAETPSEIFRLGQRQRGAVDPRTGALGSPALNAARQFARLRYPFWSGHGQSWGGFMPIPELLGDCGDGAGSILPTPNYAIFFTSIKTPPEAQRSYAGTCWNVAGHAMFVAETPWAYYVYVSDGAGNVASIDELPTADWILGPFTGGASLRKMPAGHVLRIFNAFAADFRGSDTQRAELDYHVAESFPFQRFLTSQYLLAPNVGTQKGDIVIPDYPTYRFSESNRRGGALAHGKARTYSGTKLTQILAEAKGLKNGVEIEALDADVVFTTISLTPDTDFNAEVLTAIEARSPVRLQFRLRGAAWFDTGGTITITCTELVEYRPGLEDLMLVIRCAGADNTTPDGAGISCSQARVIGENYFANGCVTNLYGHAGLFSEEAAINTNAVYDAARRRFLKMIRVVPRQNLVGYEVADGKSILYLKRYAWGAHSNIRMDLLEGLAPSPDPVASGAIAAGIRYRVKSGRLVYRGRAVLAGQEFTGETGFPDYNGSAEVLEAEGLRAVAPPQGWSNEWLMEAPLKVSDYSETSEWKASAFSDFFLWVNRCHWMGYDIAPHADLAWHYNSGQDRMVSPESPSGHNYVHGVNASADANFYKSCRIYEPPPEVESATLEDDGTVKLVFKTRFHSTLGETGGADSTVSRDWSTWDAAALTNEPFRTLENGLREYLLNQAAGHHCAGGTQPGNSAAWTNVWGGGSEPTDGACFPHLVFFKLLEKPHDDGNDLQDRHDTHITHDVMLRAELCLRAFCEGAVDARTSESLVCAMAIESLIDYTFENVCFDAFGGRWIGTLDSEQRPDKPFGAGPIPTCKLSAEVFNRFSAVTNLLTKFRVMLPLVVETRSFTYAGTRLVDAVDADDLPMTCSTTDRLAGYWSGPPAAANTWVSTSDWGLASSFSALNSATVSNSTCTGAQFNLVSSRTDVEVRIQADPVDALNAIPPGWADMVDTHLGCMASVVTHTERHTRAITTNPDEYEMCGTPPEALWHRDDDAYLKFPIAIKEVEACQVMRTGVVRAPELGGQVFAIGRTEAGENCNATATNSVSVTLYGEDTVFLEVPLV